MQREKTYNKVFKNNALLLSRIRIEDFLRHTVIVCVYVWMMGVYKFSAVYKTKYIGEFKLCIYENKENSQLVIVGSNSRSVTLLDRFMYIQGKVSYYKGTLK